MLEPRTNPRMEVAVREKRSSVSENCNTVILEVDIACGKVRFLYPESIYVMGDPC